MKKFFSAFLCLLLLINLVACKKEPSDTESKPVNPTKLNICALYDITACSLSHLMELNAQSKLKLSINKIKYK